MLNNYYNLKIMMKKLKDQRINKMKIHLINNWLCKKIKMNYLKIIKSKRKIIKINLLKIIKVIKKISNKN